MVKAEVRFAPGWPAGDDAVLVSAWMASEPACQSLSLPEVRASSANAYLSAACFSGARQNLGLKCLTGFFFSSLIYIKITKVKILAVRQVASSKRIYTEGSLACRLATVGSYFLGELSCVRI